MVESQTQPDDKGASPPIIEAGEVGALKDEDVAWETRYRAETAKSLARWLVWILAGGLLLHYVFVSVLAYWDTKRQLYEPWEAPLTLGCR